MVGGLDEVMGEIIELNDVEEDLKVLDRPSTTLALGLIIVGESRSINEI